MMYLLLIKQFLRSKTVLLTFTILMVLGGLSMYTGKQFLQQKQVAITKTIEQQKKHIETQTALHKDDLGLLLYYLKFSFIKPLKPLAGLSIGQSDLNVHIQNVKILNLEGQKYNVDLVNPMRLQVGNLDFSFLIIYLFPLVIIVLSFNVLSEEIEQGTWCMVLIQSNSSFKYILNKLFIRLLFVFIMLGLLFTMAKLILNIPFNIDFGYLISVSCLYVLFWFCLCFLVITFKKSSSINAIVLLTSWLLLVVFSPILVSYYINSRYPVNEALTMSMKQRDMYHKKWDTNKKKTIDKFYKHYPQFSKYEVKQDGFSWLWYYAMQQMGDDESVIEQKMMSYKISKRASLSTALARFLPALQVQLSMNEIANTSLNNQINYLNATTKFHEDMRLQFYSKIFENKPVNTINWSDYKPLFYKSKSNYKLINNMLLIPLISLILFVFAILRFKITDYN